MTCEQIQARCVTAGCGKFCHLTAGELKVTQIGEYTQEISVTKTVPVTTRAGVITTFTQTLVAGGQLTFEVNLTLVLPAVVLVSLQGYTGVGTPYVTVRDVSTTGFEINIANPGAPDLNAPIVIGYCVLGR